MWATELGMNWPPLLFIYFFSHLLPNQQCTIFLSNEYCWQEIRKKEQSKVRCEVLKKVCPALSPGLSLIFLCYRCSVSGASVYAHRASALTLALMLVLMLERNTLISIASFTPSVSISINASIKNQMGSGLIQKCQCWHLVWTRLKT